MNSNFRATDSFDSTASGNNLTNNTNYLNNDPYSTSINSVGSSSSLEQSWEGKNNAEARLMSQEGVYQLTKDLRRFSEALTALKTVFIEERDSSDKSMRVLAHERLGELLNVLKQVVDKYAELNSSDILSMAGTLIKHVKEFNYEEDRNDVSPDIFRSINNLAMAFCSSVSECLMGDININPQLSLSSSQSFDNLESANQVYGGQEILPVVNPVPPMVPTPVENVTSPLLENVDHTLQNIDGGLEMAFDRAKILSKYLNELITYVRKKASLEIDHAKALLKLSAQTKHALSEQSFLPFQSLYCTSLDHDKEYASNCQQMYMNDLMQQKFIDPLQAKKNEHDKRRKAIRDSWFREKRKLDEAITNMKKAKQAYHSRVQDYQKAKEAAIRAEGEQSLQTLPKHGGVGGGSTISSVLHSAAGGASKMERKKKLEEDTSIKASQAEQNYRAFVNEANRRQHDLDKNKVVYLQQLRDLITQCDQTAKTVTISFFQQHQHLFSPLPVQFQAMCEDARRYEPGFQYSDYIRNLPIQPNVNRADFEFERFAQDGSPYLVQTGSKLAESEDSPYQGRGRRSKAGMSDTESSSSRSLDDISPSASPGDLTRPQGTVPQLRRHSTEGSVSSEDVLDDKEHTGGTLAPPTDRNLEPTPNSSPLPKRNQMSKQAVKMVANVRGAFKMPKKQPKASVFGVEFSIAAQDAVDGIPYVVKRCIAEIDNRALTIKGIYRINGVKNRVEKICAQFESAPTTMELSQHSPHDVSSVLKCFLRQLPEPLLQFITYTQLLQIAKDYQQLIAETNESAKRAKEEGRPPPPLPTRDVLDALIDRIRQTVDKLPLPNRNTLQYIISHLTRVAAHSKDNKMTSSNLAIVFGPTLMRQKLGDGNESLNMLIDMPFQSRIVEMLIEHKDYIFGTHSHQAGNIFPFPGFQQAPSSYAPENVDDNALTPDSAISESEDLAASVSDLSISDQNTARPSEILLDFDVSPPFNQPSDGASATGGDDNYGTTTIDNFPINNPAIAGAINESGTLLSNSTSLIDSGTLLDLQNSNSNPFVNNFESGNPRPDTLDFNVLSHPEPVDKSQILLDFSVFETPQEEPANPSGWVVDGPPVAAKRSPSKQVPEHPQGSVSGPVAPKRTTKNRKLRRSIDDEDDVTNPRAGTKLANFVGRRLSATSFKFSNKRGSLTKSSSIDEGDSPPKISPRKQLPEPQTPTEGQGRKLPALPPHVSSGQQSTTMAGRTPPQLPLGTRKSSTLPLSLRNGDQTSQPAAKREILVSHISQDGNEASFC